MTSTQLKKTIKLLTFRPCEIEPNLYYFDMPEGGSGHRIRYFKGEWIIYGVRSISRDEAILNWFSLLMDRK